MIDRIEKLLLTHPNGEISYFQTIFERSIKHLLYMFARIDVLRVIH